ncbi:hypothetical protein WAK64_00860 [Bacillus spongiae]|uniref:Uncharacterized protein n=1 Tax=Bacillus spongiae TaxID=2683610 RepID=A0ABU8H8V2_9BACI
MKNTCHMAVHKTTGEFFGGKKNGTHIGYPKRQFLKSAMTNADIKHAEYHFVSLSFDENFTPTLAKEESEQNNAPVSQQQRRDEIVEQAKQYVAEALSDLDVEFIVNIEKRTVVALYRETYLFPDRRIIRGRGIAKCDPNDCFNVHLGKAIALRRA